MGGKLIPGAIGQVIEKELKLEDRRGLGMRKLGVLLENVRDQFVFIRAVIRIIQGTS